MRSSRSAKVRRFNRATRRGIAFEPLGARIVLSAGGLSGPLGDPGLVAHIDTHINVHERFLTEQGEFVTNQDWSFKQIAMTSGPTYPSAGATASNESFGQQTVLRTWDPPAGQSPLINSLVSSSIVAAAPQAATIYLPSWFLGNGTVLTITLVPTAAVYSSLSVPMVEPQALTHESAPADRGWGPIHSDNNYLHGGTLAPLAMPDRAAPSPATTGDVRVAGTSPSDISRLAGWLTNFVQVVGASNAADPRLAGTWSSTAMVGGTQNSSSGVKNAQLPDRWEISETDLDDGGIELESPFAQRRKGRRLADNEGLDEINELNELHALMAQMWSALGEAWAALEDASLLTQKTERTETAVATAVENLPKALDAKLVDGLIELSADGPMGVVDTLPSVAQAPMKEGAKIQMDAGVALYQEFEIATAPDAAPPQAAAKSIADESEESDEHAQADRESTEERPPSAAAIGGAVLLTVPFSLQSVLREDDSSYSVNWRKHRRV